MEGGDHFEFDPDASEFKRWQKLSHTQFKQQWSMVAIRDSTSSAVFPPINHENLHLPTSPSLSSSSSSSLSSFSPSDSDDSVPLSPTKPLAVVPKCRESRSWVGLGLGFMRSRVLGLVKAWGVASGLGVVAVVFMLWSLYLRVKQRRYRRRCELMIKEKDEKISKLLNQIAQLNEVLVARHRVLASKFAD